MIKADNILVHLPNWVGDAVMSTPALRALRENYPTSKITYIGKPITLDTVGLQFCDAQIPIKSKSLGATLKLASQLRAGRFDLGILFPNSFRSAALFALGKVKNIVGYKRDMRSIFLSAGPIPPKDSSGKFKPYPALDYYVDLLEFAEIPVKSREMEIPTEPAGDAQMRELFDCSGIDQARPIVTLNPGASNNFAKCWPADKFAAVADQAFEKLGAQIIINAAPGEENLAREIQQTMKNPVALNLADHKNSIPLLKSLLKNSSALITNDTGARHIAAALGTALVTIFISTDPVWAEINCPKERIVTVNTPFTPCEMGDENHKKFTDGVTVDMVLHALEELLNLEK